MWSTMSSTQPSLKMAMVVMFIIGTSSNKLSMMGIAIIGAAQGRASSGLSLIIPMVTASKLSSPTEPPTESPRGPRSIAVAVI